MLDLSKITTEKRNQNTQNIDLASTEEMLRMINDEDKTVPYAVEKAIPQIAAAVDTITHAFSKGGRLFYLGAGTSGRLGVLDASECPPTFGVPYNRVIGLIAGGDQALRTSIEDAEDSFEAAAKDLQSHHLKSVDVVVGIAASGVTPYPIGGLKYAKSLGCKTVCITTAANSEIAKIADFPIEAITGAEPLTGSTRMKSGTAQKLILNMLTTASMVKIGKVYENLMIDVQMSNNKLVSRAQNIVMDITGAPRNVVQRALKKFRSVKLAIFSIMANIDDQEMLEKILAENHGNIRESLKHIYRETPDT